MISLLISKAYNMARYFIRQKNRLAGQAELRPLARAGGVGHTR